MMRDRRRADAQRADRVGHEAATSGLKTSGLLFDDLGVNPRGVGVRERLKDTGQPIVATCHSVTIVEVSNVAQAPSGRAGPQIEALMRSCDQGSITADQFETERAR